MYLNKTPADLEAARVYAAISNGDRLPSGNARCWRSCGLLPADELDWVQSRTEQESARDRIAEMLRVSRAKHRHDEARTIRSALRVLRGGASLHGHSRRKLSAISSRF